MAPAVPHLAASDSITFRHELEYFQVPSIEPPQAPAKGQIAAWSSSSSAKRVKCETRPVTLVPSTLEGTGNHWPAAGSSQATTARLPAGTPPARGRLSATGTVKVVPLGPKS